MRIKTPVHAEAFRAFIVNFPAKQAARFEYSSVVTTLAALVLEKKSIARDDSHCNESRSCQTIVLP